jgi:hypothetical protein
MTFQPNTKDTTTSTTNNNNDSLFVNHNITIINNKHDSNLSMPTSQMILVIISVTMFILIVAGRVGFIVYKISAGLSTEMTHYNELFTYVLILAMIPPTIGIVAAKDELIKNAQRIRMV